MSSPRHEPHGPGLQCVSVSSSRVVRRPELASHNTPGIRQAMTTPFYEQTKPQRRAHHRRSQLHSQPGRISGEDFP